MRLTSAIRSIFTAAILLACLHVQAQQEAEEPQKGFDPERLFFGGNFGLSFGDYTFINITPQVGYQFNRYFAAGGGLSFIGTGYTYRDYNGDKLYKDTYNSAGLNIFGRVSPIPFLFIQAQPEYNYTWGKTKFYNGQPDIKLDGEFVPVLLLGAGAVIPAGRGSFIAMLQYNVIQNDRSVYGDRPFLSFGFNF
ncbi:MAG: hypothetical protein MUE58_07610 [Chitinophagaceae bacterium]|jgi:hypothetical protein|nr:hypothetical protein [Chitinophagaceae bacterium]